MSWGHSGHGGHGDIPQHDQHVQFLSLVDSHGMSWWQGRFLGEDWFLSFFFSSQDFLNKWFLKYILLRFFCARFIREAPLFLFSLFPFRWSFRGHSSNMLATLAAAGRPNSGHRLVWRISANYTCCILLFNWSFLEIFQGFFSRFCRLVIAIFGHLGIHTVDPTWFSHS